MISDYPLKNEKRNSKENRRETIGKRAGKNK
jgi:hypothetical protein